MLSTQFTFGPLQMLQDKNRQGTLSQTPNRDRARAGLAQLSHQGGHLPTSCAQGEHTEHRAEGSAHGITALLHLNPALQSELPLLTSFSHTQPCQKASSEECVSIRLNHKRQQTIDPLLIHTPQKNSGGSGKLSFSTARVTRGGCKSKTVGCRVCSWSPL